ncbi:uncharacterized protein LOC135487487 isoform X2 [Lineus longissimus]|uniref:uncharacterized protein LOC135487487 isoform X2 n=1 Tax=Lineus longissimus TaxID=88925 RepID=UPI00315D38A9
MEERIALIIGLSVGVVGAVAIVVLVVVAYICCRKKCTCLEASKLPTQKSKTKEDYTYVQADHDITQVPSERDDGMVDNILYEPMGVPNSTGMTTRTGGTVYADVQIESNNMGGQNGSYIRQETPSVVYSEVRVNPETVYSEVQPNPDSADTVAKQNPDSAYSDVTVKANVEAPYSVVNKSFKRPPLPPKALV